MTRYTSDYNLCLKQGINEEKTHLLEQSLSRKITQMKFKFRKEAREMLECASCQLFANCNSNLDKRMLMLNQSMIAELAREEISNYKDPGRNNVNTKLSKTTFSYKDNTKKQLIGLLRPDILKNDTSIAIEI